MARAKQGKMIQQMSVAQWEKAFPDEDACDAFLGRAPLGRWRVFCPRCGSMNVYRAVKAWNWECPDCRRAAPIGFPTSPGTIFENTKVDLREWFRVIHLMLTGKKGTSSLQIRRYMGFGSYKTARYMCPRIRAGCKMNEFQKLMGIVEMDQTFVGGIAKNRHEGQAQRAGKGGTGRQGPVIGAVSRKRTVVARVIENVPTGTSSASSSAKW